MINRIRHSAIIQVVMPATTGSRRARTTQKSLRGNKKKRKKERGTASPLQEEINNLDQFQRNNLPIKLIFEFYKTFP